MKKKNKRNNSSKYDWKIIATEYLEEEKNADYPELDVEYRTSGFAKYGHGEVIVVGSKRNAKKVANLINTFCRMYKEGEKFDSNYTHCIDNAKGVTEVRFNVVYGKYSDGEKWTQLVPLFS